MSDKTILEQWRAMAYDQQADRNKLQQFWAAYFNIGIKRLRRIAEDNLGTVAVYCGNRFLIIRPKFEEFILNSSEI